MEPPVVGVVENYVTTDGPDEQTQDLVKKAFVSQAFRRTRFYVTKLASSVALVFVVVLLMFILLQLAPGDPVQALVGQVPVTPAFRHSIEAQYGLGGGIWQQLWAYLKNVATGNLGYSYANRQEVLPLILSKFGNTLIITVPSMILAAIGAFVLGTVAGATRSKLHDRVLVTSAVAGFSIPSFWLGLMMIWLFSVKLGWLPAQGMNAIAASGGTSVSNMVMPCICLTVPEMAFMLRIMRSAVIETLGQDYIDTARAKGMTRIATLRRHVLLNSSLPMVSVIGYSVVYAIAGVVLVEKVFAWPGVGLLLYDALQDSDHLVVMGILLFISVVVVIANIVTDVVYRLVDPRLRQRMAPQS